MIILPYEDVIKILHFLFLQRKLSDSFSFGHWPEIINVARCRQAFMPFVLITRARSLLMMTGDHELHNRALQHNNGVEMKWEEASSANLKSLKKNQRNNDLQCYLSLHTFNYDSATALVNNVSAFQNKAFDVKNNLQIKLNS